jgi:penicillin-binding protein 1C
VSRRQAILAGAGLAALVAGGVALWLFALAAPGPVPSFAQVRSRHRPSDLRLLDRHGEVIHEHRTDPERRRLRWTALDEVSPALRAAVLEAEDRRFMRHAGVDARAAAAAVVERLTGRGGRGASTVTMQLAAFVDPGLRHRGEARTVVQKWRQVRLALAIERDWSKPEILEAYLNLATFRGELDGVRAAASLLFAKEPHGITEPEAVVLAALLRAPNARMDAVARRAGRLADRLGWRADGATLDSVVASAMAPATGPGPRVALAPHAAVRLAPAWGRGAPTGADVPSTLDAAVQQAAAEALRRHLAAVRARGVRDGAVLVVDNDSGEVLAYVGGDPERGSARYVSGIHARRQAGSSLKPFVYALALDERLLTPASLLEDSPLEIAVAGGLYRPRNYDGEFRGLVSVRTALASSLNVPAVRALDLAGVEAALDRLRQLGFTGLVEDGDFYGPSLALGSADVSLWELVGAYRALARGGVWSPIRLSPADPSEPGRRVYSAEAAHLVGHILADRESRGATFGLESPLATPFWTAVKTGTSKEMRDNWCVGFSRRYTVGVWVGNFSGEPMRDVSGVTGAAPIWSDVMAWLHRSVPSRPPAAPLGVVSRPVRFPAASEPRRVEWFLAGTEPDTTAPAPAAGRARIVAPVGGTVIALDPDIPRDLQRVVLEASGSTAGARFTVDGQPVGAEGGLVVWPPVPGRHVVALLDADDREVDRVRIEVRGPARVRAPGQ